VTQLMQPRTGVAPLQLPPLWLIALVLLTLAAVVSWAAGQEGQAGKSGAKTDRLEGHRDGIFCVEFSPHGNLPGRERAPSRPCASDKSAAARSPGDRTGRWRSRGH